MTNFYRFADTVGDGSGTINAIGTYAAAAEEFILSPPSGQVYEVARMLVTLQDTGALDAEEYGNGITLTKGVVITGQSKGQAIEITDPNLLVTTNALWGAYCYDVDAKTWGTGDELLLVRWTFSKAGSPIVLDSRAGDFIKITLNDDYDDLVGHYFHFQGESFSLKDWK